MKTDIYYLIENEKVLHRSASLAKLINYTTETKDAKIMVNGSVVWVQNP